MDGYKDVLIIVIALCVLGMVVHGYSRIPLPFDNVETLNIEICNEVTKPTSVGYEYVDYPCPRYPDISDNGLTYTFTIPICVMNESFTAPLDSIPLFKAIYRDILDRLNSIRRIRPFLAEFPLTPASCDLYLTFRDKEKHIRMPPYVQSIRLFHEVLEINPYRSFDKEKEALQKANVKLPAREVLQEFYTPTLPPKQPGPKPKIPPLTRLSWRCDTAWGASRLRFLKRFCHAHGLEITIIGVAGSHAFDRKPFGFALRGSQRLSLDEARQLAATCSKELMAYAKNDPPLIEYMKKRGANPLFEDPATVAEPRHCAFRISFWDEDIDRVQAPAIAEIRINGESFQYFTADEHQRLVLTLEETYAQATAFLEESCKDDKKIPE